MNTRQKKFSLCGAPLRSNFLSITVAAAVLLAACPGSRADTLFVSTHDNTILTFGLDGNGSLFANTGLSSPRGIAFDSVGNVYVGNYNDSTIQKFTLGGVHLGVFASTGLSNPQGLAFDSAGNLYAANAGNNTIQKFTPDGLGSTFASTGLSVPSGLAFDRTGNLYVSNYGSDTIEKFTSDGLDLGTLVNTGLRSPLGLAFDSAGVLSVASQDTHRIERFTTDGLALGTFASTGLDHPFGLAFDSAGNLYAANVGDYTIQKFTPEGVVSFFATSGNGNNPVFLAIHFEVIPEPSTGALLGLAGAILLALYRVRMWYCRLNSRSSFASCSGSSSAASMRL